MGEDFPQEFGQYTLHELIGRGGMAEIYRATMPGIGGFEKTVAIKKILPHLAEDDEFTSMLIDEARIIESLDHSNIAQVFDLGRREGTYYIAMEYIHGVDLSEIIDELEERGTYIPIPHVIHITSSICAGLHFAHNQTDEEGNPLNVIHRDISPHNIRLSFAGEVKIIDFGVAKAADREADTQMGVIKGKLLYMAPEQAKAEDLDGRADLFATGLCAYKMLTGELPFEGDNEFQVYNNILQKDIVPPQQFRPEIPDELNRIVMTLLRRDREARYQQGYEAKQDLDQLLHEVAPGYTVNQLSRWVEQNYSHLAQQEGGPDAKTVTSNPSDVAPSTPTDQRNPGTGQHAAPNVEAPRGDADQVREPVGADGGQPPANSTTQPSRPDQLEDGGAAPADPSPLRTRTSSDETTGQYEADRRAEETDGLSGVVYAIGVLIVANVGMVAYTLTVEDDGAGGPGDRTAAAAGADDEASPEPTGMIRVNIDSSPQGARLVRKGEVVGRTPIEVVLPRGEDPIELTLVNSGYADRTIELIPNEDVEQTIELTARPDAGLAAGPDAGDTGVAGGAARAESDESDDEETTDDESASASDSEESETATGAGGSGGSRGGSAGGSEKDSEDEAGDDSGDSSGGIGAAPDRDEGGAESSDDFGSGETSGSESTGTTDSEPTGPGDSESADTNGSESPETGAADGDAGSESTSGSDDHDEIIDPFAQ